MSAIATQPAPTPGHETQVRLLKAETVPLTKDLAERFRDMPGSVTERPYSPERVDWLAGKLAQGEFLPPLWVTAVIAGSGEELRVNGQHTSTMLSRSEAIPDDLMVHMEQFEVAQESDTVLLFRQFDSPKSARTSAEIIHAYKQLVPALKPLEAKPLEQALRGLAWGAGAGIAKDSVLIPEAHPPADKEQLGELCNQQPLHEFLIWWTPIIGQFAKGKGKLKVGDRQVVCAAFRMHDRDARQADIFWRQVLNREATDQDAPVYKMAEYLEQIALAPRDRWLKNVPDEWTKNKFPYLFCNVCWTNFRKKLPVREIRVPARKTAPDWV